MKKIMKTGFLVENISFQCLNDTKKIENVKCTRLMKTLLQAFL